MLSRLKFDITDLVNEMLDQLPAELWTSKTTTFLDPAMGGGQFVREIERRLREAGHSNSNIAKRVFGFENSHLRIKYAINKYNLVGTYRAENFLEVDMGMKFDCAVGNPPYQKPNQSDRLGSRGNSSIWDKFVIKSHELLEDGGYLAMMHPTAWRKPKDRFGFWNMLTQENQMHYLNMYSGKGEQDAFGIGVRFDCYVIEKTVKYTTTKVIDHEQVSYDLDLSDFPWLPNYAIDEIASLFGEQDVLYNTKYHTQKDCSDTQTSQYKYPVVHTINKDGLGIKWFKERDSETHFGVKKVLLNQNELQYPVNDYTGEYGMSQLTFGIPIASKKEGDKIIKFLNSEKGKKLIAATKWNTFYTDYNMFLNLKKEFYE